MYKRDPKLLLTKVEKVTQDNNTSVIIAKEQLHVHIPKFYENLNIATFGERVTTVGIFAIIDSAGHYTASLAPSLVVMEPTAVGSINIQEMDYYDLTFDVGDKLIVDTRIAKEAAFIYRSYATFLSAGYIPWFINDILLTTLFVNMEYFTEKKFSPYSAIIELIISAMSRNPENIDETYRQYLNELKPNAIPKPPKFIALRNFAITANSKLNKFMGSHFEEGLTGALTSATYEPTILEQILRQ